MIHTQTTSFLHLFFLFSLFFSVRLVNLCPELIYVTGSILGNTKYLFEKIEFYWAKTHTGVAGSKIDGVGYANYLSDLQV